MELLPEGLALFVVLSAIVTASSEVLKKLIHEYSPDLKVGLLIAVILGVIVAFASNQGFVCTLFWRPNQANLAGKPPAMFKQLDLLMTGLLYSLSSKTIISVYKQTHELKVPENQSKAPESKISESKEDEEISEKTTTA